MSMSSTESDDNAASYSGQLLTESSEVMVSAVIFFMVVLVFVFFLYLYAKHYWVPERERGSSFIVFAASSAAAIESPGLDATILESLPITIFQSTHFKEAGGLECSVCLCEVTDGEEVRLLPKCRHGFHLECIDMWFHSHSTCPLCRSPITSPPDHSDDAEDQHQAATNCLAGPSTMANPRDLVIEIPIRPAAGIMDLAFPSPTSPLPTSKFPGDDDQIMKTPTSATSWQQLRSLRRLLSSRGKRPMPSNSTCTTPIESAPLDIEHGIVIPGISPLTPSN